MIVVGSSIAVVLLLWCEEYTRKHARSVRLQRVVREVKQPALPAPRGNYHFYTLEELVGEA